MKKFFVLSLLVSVLTGAVAQDFCGTVMPEEDLAWLRDYKMNNRGPFYNKSSNAVSYIPVKVHIVGTNNGANYYSYGALLDAFCTLNEQFADYNWQFYMYDEVNYINNDDLYYHRNNYNNTLNNNCVVDVVNMFFVGFDPNGYNVCGYYSRGAGPRPAGSQFRQGVVVINKSCADDGNSTIAHELGHFFSLPHTFFGWEGRGATASARSTDERVNGSNCSTSGDYFCDTPADFLSDRWNCPYNLTKTDFLGTPYNPDGSLYMSYANDACQNYFSVEQLDAMRSNLAQQRPYLNQGFPNYPIIVDTAKLQYPLLGAVNVPSNFVNLRWDAVPGATHYHVQCTRSLNPNVWNVDTIVQGNSVLLNSLQTGFNYRWRVRAFNKYSTCSPYSTFFTFITGQPTSFSPVITVDQVSCAGAYDGSILLDVTGGQGPYSYTWASGSNGAQQTFLEGGTYVVTITDNSNESLVLSIDIKEPAPLDLELVLDGNLLLAQAEGGTAPYTYLWSSGETTSGIDPSNGNYTVTITDANGCQSTKSYSYVGINDVDAATMLRVYPNPTSNASSFSVELTVPLALSASIEVVDNAGRRVYNANKDFETGVNTTQVPLSQLAPGVYFVRIVSQNLVKTTKILVY